MYELIVHGLVRYERYGLFRTTNVYLEYIIIIVTRTVGKSAWYAHTFTSSLFLFKRFLKIFELNQAWLLKAKL